MVARDFEIRTDRLRLRAFLPTDAARMVEIQSNWNVTRMLRLAPWPPTEAAMIRWVDLHGEEWLAGKAYRFAVEHEGRVIGCADIDAVENGSADIGYWFDEAYWGGGYASEAAGAVVRFAFETLGLTRLTAGHVNDNPGSGKVLLKLGFIHVADGMRDSLPRGEGVPYRFYVLAAPI
ncbi:GNAT family N-acetyltransferase [Phenylobacterium aquaticum]|uniref:GNAT family N-acetyltransferase n=1 Tax=Phenylobacterium aquaticum TaxID=1763816 RepID=UPI0026F29724|nr:GNAT family N-acetyltransferase [Phenylobacterium aquaticum]